jgi:hypothetical protein
MKCSICGDEHDLLEPAFARPDVIFQMTAEEKRGRVWESDDICALRGVGEPDRYFVRGFLPVRLLDAPGATAWGLWAEVGEDDAKVIYDRWDDADQAAHAPFEATLANRVPGYPDTLGLPLSVQLMGPKTRPSLAFDESSIHPFARECLAGVCVHRVMEWLMIQHAP